jgi:hypothetical protein
MALMERQDKLVVRFRCGWPRLLCQHPQKLDLSATGWTVAKLVVADL